MLIKTPADIGALIRENRTKLGLDQKSLAQKVGVSRQWIVEVEKGKAGAPIGLLLRTISVLGISLTTGKGGPGKQAGTTPQVDIDSIVAAARRKRK
jgi:HTH-type transcriptional regulator / antitoxin HipB